MSTWRSAELVAFALLALFCRAAALDCWGGGLTEELCCHPAPTGNNACFDGDYTFETCCADVKPRAPGGPSLDLSSLRVEKGSVPNLPLLGGGGMPASGVGLCCRSSASGDAVRQGVLDYLLVGGRNLDTAQLYGNHREVGQGVREAIALGVPREEIFLTTKQIPSEFGFEATTAWVTSMLEELGVDYVDLVLLHWAGTPDGNPECKVPKQCRQETWMALERAKHRGLIRHLGVSNFGQRQIEELTPIAPIEVNQLEYHPWVPQLHRDTVAYCHQHGIVVTAYGSMGSAGLVQQMIAQDGIRQMGERHGKTAGQVLLRWAVQQNVSVIPGTSNPKHQAENLRVFDFELSPEEMGMLNSIPEEQRMLHFNHYPDARP